MPSDPPRARRLPPAPFVYPILDADLLRGRPVEEALSALARAGLRLAQVRAKRMSDRDYLELARRAVAAARPLGITLVVNDRADVARIVDADGVHVGQDDLPAEAVRAVVGAGPIVGVSTHSAEQLAAVLAAPGAVDYVAVGPVFPTRTKENPDPVVGLDLVRRARAATRLPLVAIGGITRGNARSVVEAGADGVAVISDLLGAEDLEDAAAALRAAIGARIGGS